MKRGRFIVLIRVALGFLGIFALLLFERVGILYSDVQQDVNVLTRDQVTHIKETTFEKTCLLIKDSEKEGSEHASKLYEQILEDMRVPYDEFDLAEDEVQNMQRVFNDYETIILCINDYDPFGEEVLSITRWVGKGGRALIGIPPSRTDTFDIISNMLGINSAAYTYGLVPDFESEPDFMLGAQKVYPITDPYESSIMVELDGECDIHASTSDGSVPLIWSRDYKDGKFVVCNFGYSEKAYRGIYSSAYSLLQDVFAYPVINASTFYIDDFPSPVPGGNGEYVMRDYQMGIADFYSTIWWPDMLSLGDTHNIKYTGLIIETYEDKTYGELKSNDSTADYYYYGNMLLNRGGELGYHGYNHQPLCLPNFVYDKELGYNTWENADVMYSSIDELLRFSKGIFPGADMSVYVPPSDILSDEGRYMLGQDFSDIRCIASIYLEGSDEYYQEFTVASDGMVETPRIISGGDIDDYMKITAFSELNLHFVCSHFMHPDDLLDEDRGAALGWEVLKNNLEDYMKWIDESAVDIRHLTGSGMAGAVQRFTNVVPSLDVQDDSITLNSEGIIDSAYFLVRVNEGELSEAYGGELKKLNDTLYLLKVQSPKVVVTRR